MNDVNANNFLPLVIENKENRCLSELPLDNLLASATQNKLIVLRGFMPLCRETLLNWCQSQARLLSWDFGPVMEMRVDKETKNYLFTDGDVPLHWDGAFYQEPRFLFFHCLQAPAPDTGGETLFVDTERVWACASDEDKREWAACELSFSTEKLAHYGGHISLPLVNQHPGTSKTVLRFAEPVGDDYLNPVTVSVMGKTAAESTALLAGISKKMRLNQHCYQHVWQGGDYLIADNFSLLHGRNAFCKSTARHLRRIQIL